MTMLLRVPRSRWAFRAPVLTLLALLLAPPVLRAETAVVPASRDNTLFFTQDGSLSSGAGAHFFAGANSTLNVRRGVIAFDVAANIPAGASIDSVALVLNVSSAPNDTPQPIDLHRVLADWGEGTSVSGGGAGAPSAPGDATWIHRFYPGQAWASAGGDFAPAASATQLVGVSGAHVWTSSAMASDVQAWLDQPATNFGWLLRGAEATASSVRRFDTRENATPENRPYLVVRYSLPNAARPATWGSVKSIYRIPASK